MIDPQDRRVGDQLAGNGEFVVGQRIDKGLTGADRNTSGEGQDYRVSCAREGYTGPVPLTMTDKFGLASGKLEQGG